MICEPLCGFIGPHINAMLQREARMNETFISAALWCVLEVFKRPLEPMWRTRCTGSQRCYC